jgi:diguanylate cyclase (GGDEF)-like protein/putative nucleotidyltransferase with HDIG domain
LTASIRADLYFGVVYGLAASAVAWTLALAPAGSAWQAVWLAPLAVACGTLGARSRWLGPLTPTYPAAVAGASIGGPAVGVVMALLTALSWRAVGPWSGHTGARRSLAFELSSVALAASGSAWAFHGLRAARPGSAVVEYVGAFAVHAALWAVAVGATSRLAILVRRGSLGPRVVRRRWQRSLRYAVGAAAGGGLALVWGGAEGPFLLVALAVLVLACALFNARLGEQRARRRTRLEAEAQAAAVVRGLCRLVEARDAGTIDHLRRVQRRCLDVGARLGLGGTELEGLAAAALLHDIGKLAVPEGILSKPGRLTPEEVARMRIHPEVGANVLEAIAFPYPVAPIVRHHHERWDGQGYPAGLRAEEIPVGARILAVVDSYDALTTDRPYRRALARGEALGYLEQEAGQSFDPAVVEVLLEQLEAGEHDEAGERGTRPGPVAAGPTERGPTSGSLPRAQRELQLLYEIERARERRLELEEYLTLVACKLRRLVSHRSLVVYTLDRAEAVLRAAFAMGEAAEELAGVTIPLGERLSGWAAMQRRAFVGHDHRSPIDRDGCRSDLEDRVGDGVTELASTLVAPIVHEERVIGTLTLYDGAERRFTPEERRLLVRVAGCIAPALDRPALAAEGDRSLTDPLTGVPNARFLRLETDHRIALHREGDPGFGLLAFRVGGLEQVGERSGKDEADRMLCRIARRFAASCRSHETLVRLGQELFVVLSSAALSGELVERWHELRDDVERPPLCPHGSALALRLSAAHAAFPEDGHDLDVLLEVLDGRLGLAEQRRIVPFRAAASTRRGRSA